MDFDTLPNAIPDTWDLPFSKVDLDTCVTVLGTVIEKDLLNRHEALRKLRKILAPLISEKLESIQQTFQTRTEKVIPDKELIDQTVLRKMRKQFIEKQEEDTKCLYFLDGPVNEEEVNLIKNSEEHDNPVKGQKLCRSRRCYICQQKFNQLHFFYDQLCTECGEFNFQKRTFSVDMRGKNCIVTGCRLKIGYQTSLKILRAGGTLIGTTRFPYDAIKRFSLEKDFNDWKGNLFLFSLDLRFIQALEEFCNFVKTKWDHLDVIINNACQTIQRPRKFYEQLITNESQISNDEMDKYSTNLQLNYDFHETLKNKFLIHNISYENESLLQISGSNEENTLFPIGKCDVHGQQIDLRTSNSWILELHEISTIEFAEVFVINSIAPAILNARLKPLMEKRMNDLKFIVNVSAMEGKFYRNKNSKHPHTNMAKAALNMMTRTSAQDYLKSNIYMTSVDTGWINDENPRDIALRNMEKLNFNPPLDEVDAAARILDPIFSALHEKLTNPNSTKQPESGVFLKNYAVTHW